MNVGYQDQVRVRQSVEAFGPSDGVDVNRLILARHQERRVVDGMNDHIAVAAGNAVPGELVFRSSGRGDDQTGEQTQRQRRQSRLLGTSEEQFVLAHNKNILG